MNEFPFDDWWTTNQYDSRYKVPEGKGVYVIVEYFIDGTNRILYVGSSSDLYKRIQTHEVIRISSFFVYHMKIYWKNFINPLFYEYKLINEILPPLNKKFQ